VPLYDTVEFPYFVRGFYAENVAPPKIPGALAFETKHRTEGSRDIEITAAESRDDIGEIYWGHRTALD
jgi:hypothetical protein